MKKHTLYLIFLLLLTSIMACSDDASTSRKNDIIVGKWRTIEKYESNVQVPLTTCEPYFFTEYKSDSYIITYRVVTANLPEECGLISSELGWNWKNMGNNKYRIRFLEEQGQIVTIYKEGENLVIEDTDGFSKVVCEPY